MFTYTFIWPFLVNLYALLMRLMRTCLILLSSWFTKFGIELSYSKIKSISFSSIYILRRSIDSSTQVYRLKSVSISLNFPLLIYERSKISNTRQSISLLEFLATLRNFFPSSSLTKSSRRSVIPIIANRYNLKLQFKGVLSSWEVEARIRSWYFYDDSSLSVYMTLVISLISMI